MSDRLPAVTVVIPTLAADEALTECLTSLTGQSFRDFQIVVVDNSGRGAVKRLAGAYLQGVHIIEMDRNVGFGAAVNAGWQLSGSSHLAALNDDAVAEPGWLEALVRAAARWPGAGMFASCVTFSGPPSDDEKLDSAGMLLCADGSSKQRGHGEPVSGFKSEQEVLLPSASAALYRASMLNSVGAFDPDFFLYCEDTDLGLRARRAGWNCVYVPSAKVAHRYSHSAGRVSSLKAYFVERNRLFVLVKNAPLPMLLASPFVALARYGWHLAFMMQGKGSAAKFASESGQGWRLPLLVMKAHLALLRHLPRLFRQRRAIRRQAILPNGEFLELLRRFSISPRRIAGY